MRRFIISLNLYPFQLFVIAILVIKLEIHSSYFHATLKLTKGLPYMLERAGLDVQQGQIQ